MKTIALRFSESFAPSCGTIAAHQAVIDQLGYVWYGKMGLKVSTKIQYDILHNRESKILLIRSGRVERYWAFVTEISNETPPPNEIPEYYRDIRYTFKTWFKVVRLQLAEKNVMKQYIVSSSLSPLSLVSKHSMSPYFIIQDMEDEHGV